MAAPFHSSPEPPAEPQWLGAGVAALIGTAALALTGFVLRDALRGARPAAATAADLVALPIGLGALALAWALAQPGRVPRAVLPIARWVLPGVGVLELVSGGLRGVAAGWTWDALSQVLMGGVFVLMGLTHRSPPVSNP